MLGDIIATSANVALTLSVIVAVIFGIIQAKQAARDRRERLALDTLRNFQSREFAELMHYINSQHMPTSFAQMRARSADEQVKYIQFSMQMEMLGLLVAEGLIGIDLVDKTLGAYVMTTWEKYKQMFEDARVKAPDPYLGEYFQWLAEHIDERVRQSNREPFYKQVRPTEKV